MAPIQHAGGIDGNISSMHTPRRSCSNAYRFTPYLATRQGPARRAVLTPRADDRAAAYILPFSARRISIDIHYSRYGAAR